MNKDSKKIKDLIDKSSSLIKNSDVIAKLKDSKDQVILFIEMLKSHYNGEFKIKKKALIYIVMAIVYFINPLDLIPDILLWGLIDDLTVIGWVYKKIDSEIKRYHKFKEKKIN